MIKFIYLKKKTTCTSDVCYWILDWWSRVFDFIFFCFFWGPISNRVRNFFFFFFLKVVQKVTEVTLRIRDCWHGKKETDIGTAHVTSSTDEVEPEPPMPPTGTQSYCSRFSGSGGVAWLATEMAADRKGVGLGKSGGDRVKTCGRDINKKKNRHT